MNLVEARAYIARTEELVALLRNSINATARAKLAEGKAAFLEAAKSDVLDVYVARAEMLREEANHAKRLWENERATLSLARLDEVMAEDRRNQVRR